MYRTANDTPRCEYCDGSDIHTLGCWTQRQPARVPVTMCETMIEAWIDAVRSSPDGWNGYESNRQAAIEDEEDPAERAWAEAEMRRGPLAGAPDELCCYECNGYDGATWKVQTVTALAGVSGGPDPWQLYRLACGHTVMGCEHRGLCKDRTSLY